MKHLHHGMDQVRWREVLRSATFGKEKSEGTVFYKTVAVCLSAVQMQTCHIHFLHGHQAAIPCFFFLSFLNLIYPSELLNMQMYRLAG